MSYSQMVKLLRQKHKEEILLINAGAFYIAIEEDVVLLNNKLKLKCSCFQKNTCKVGVPINSIEKYLEKIQTLDKQEIIVVGYNNIADFVLKNLKKKDKVFINGNLNTKMEIKIKECEIIKNETEC